MMKSFKRWRFQIKAALFAFPLFLPACLHISDKIDRLPLRATKIQIVDRLGAPFHIQRKDGMDHWIYKFVIDGRHWTKAVIIKEGNLYKIGKLKPYSLKNF